MPDYFTLDHEKVLWSLAQHGAALLERLEGEEKRRKVNKVKEQVVGQRDWDGTINLVMNAILETLGYEYVNISLIEPENNCIRSRYVVGLPEEEAVLFMKMAVHPLDSTDIQAEIVRERG